MIACQRDMRIPSGLVPHCPVCGAPMTMNLRCDELFVQDEGWYAAQRRYDDFLRGHKRLSMLYLELGVGLNTPGIIKLPFWEMTLHNAHATYACLNLGEAFFPQEIAGQSLCIDEDVGRTLERLVSVE